MSTLLIGLGLVLVIEGLVFALAPRHIETALRALIELPVDMRRLVGLCALAIGVLLVWVARFLSGA